MKWALYASVAAVLFLQIYVLNASENQGQLVLIVGRDKEAILRSTGKLDSCSFTAQNLNDSVGASMMKVVRDVDSPSFLVLKTGERAYISITTDDRQRTHIHEKTNEVERLRQDFAKAKASIDRAKALYNKSVEDLRVLREQNDQFEKKKIECIRIAKKVAIGAGVSLAGVALLSWFCNCSKECPSNSL